VPLIDKMKLKNIVYVNGSFLDGYDNHISLMDRGFNLADGIFETMVASNQRIFCIDDHLKRLGYSAEVLNIDLLSPNRIRDILYETVKQNDLDYGVVRLTVTRGVDHKRGLEVHENITPSIMVRIVPWNGPANDVPEGKRLYFSSVVRNDLSPLANIKSLAYTESVIARIDAQKNGFDDALMLNTKHSVTGATSSNIFLVMGGKLITPPLSDGVLSGIARSRIIKLAESMKMPFSEQSITKTHIEYSQEIFISNIVTGIVPVKNVEENFVMEQHCGPLTKQLFELYRNILIQELS
tara:strand:+ start:6419 stop:7303 length:885 start_codon:yes stop_codon:yes gene_type:complete